MVAKHEHDYYPFKVGYVHTADNLPDYFMARVVCIADDCDEEYTAITEAKDS